VERVPQASLQRIAAGTRPKALVETLSENALKVSGEARLIDPYDVYQRLMDYWAGTMQDDVYMIVGEGWLKSAKPRLIVEDKDKKNQAEGRFHHRPREV